MIYSLKTGISVLDQSLPRCLLNSAAAGPENYAYLVLDLQQNCLATVCAWR